MLGFGSPTQKKDELGVPVVGHEIDGRAGLPFNAMIPWEDQEWKLLLESSERQGGSRVDQAKKPGVVDVRPVGCSCCRLIPFHQTDTIDAARQ